MDDNRISTSITAVAASTSGLVQYSVEVEDLTDPGIVLVPVWSGDGLMKFSYGGPQTVTQTITENALYFGGGGFSTGSPRGAIGKPGGEKSKSADRVLRVKRKPIRMGKGSNTINLVL
jgi:hypothetical protein